MAKNNAAFFDPNMWLSCGVDPKTGLPLKFEGGVFDNITKADVRRQLNQIDLQTSLNKYTWYGLYPGLNAKIMERLFYFRGQFALIPYEDKFYSLPYTLNGEIDIYGRFKGISVLPFQGTTNDKKSWLPGRIYEPVYDVQIPEDYAGIEEDALFEILENKAVLFKDHSEALTQIVEPMVQTMSPTLDLMSEIFPFMRTALINSTGIRGMRVDNENDNTTVWNANVKVTEAALAGKPFIPVTASINASELTGGTVGKAEEYLLAMQSLDNYRLSLHGLSHGGLFQKKSHMLEAEQNANNGNSELVLLDGLRCRQEGCLIANSLWGGQMWCEISESVLNVDRDGDGEASSEFGETPTGSGSVSDRKEDMPLE